MRIVFFGTPTFAVPTLKKLLANPDIEVIAVVTQPDKRRGRGNQLIPSPVKQIAIEQQIPVLQPKSVKKNAKTLDFL
ncbi:MAG: methionyl-tRNA formyltransferase, partial [Microcystis sp. LE19-338.1B]|nr:methionyl-tRNA formyltransferase [Microcystis sp. LE19-338.1B]